MNILKYFISSRDLERPLDQKNIEKKLWKSLHSAGTYSSFSNSSGMTKLGFCKSWCAPISLKLPWSWSRAPQKLSTSERFKMTCRALHRLVESVKEKGSWVFMTWKVFLGALEQLHGSYSAIGAHQDFQKPEFFMPELLLKELWSGLYWRDFISASGRPVRSTARPRASTNLSGKRKNLSMAFITGEVVIVYEKNIVKNPVK